MTYSLGVLFDGVAVQRAEATVPDILTSECQSKDTITIWILLRLGFIDKMKSKEQDKRPQLEEVLNFNWKKYLPFQLFLHTFFF